MIEIRVARYPDGAAAVEAIFREYVVGPTASVEFQDDARRNPAAGAAFPGCNL